MTLSEYYTKLIDNSKEIIQLSLNDDKLGFSKCHAFLEDLNDWKPIIEDRYERELYFYAINEYQRSLYLALHGSYRHAFMALRFFIEHTCAAIYFSCREIEFRMWTKGDIDISWSKITDENSGVFSTRAIDIFFNELNNNAGEFQALARKIYRECSEFTHGNYVTYDSLDLELTYNEDVFERFIETVKSTMILITFLLTTRFYKEVDLNLNPNIGNSISDHIGFIEYFAYQNS